MTDSRDMPAGLRRAYLYALLPAAALAPVPLVWTGGAATPGLALYEAALVFLAIRARRGTPLRLSATALNVAGLLYFFWLGLELTSFRHSLLRTVSHLLLFTAAAKLASLKHAGEARMALLVVFLLTLAAASSATHIVSLLYLAAMAVLALRLLGRLGVLADFEEAPPDRVVRAVPTPGMAMAALAAALGLGAPLFYALPRLQRPYAVAPFRLETGISGGLAADRVDLEAFGAAKRSDRVVLRVTVDPPAARPRVLRLREAVFTEYARGEWRRRTYRGRERFVLPDHRPGGRSVGRVAIDQSLFGSGFLFLPYAFDNLAFAGRPNTSPLPDGLYQAVGRGALAYTVTVQNTDPRGPGTSVIDPGSVPAEIRAYAAKLTGDLTDPRAIAARIEEHFARDFLYTLDAPQPQGDPLVHFLLRARAGHCEYFASAAAMMLTARGIGARLVTGSYGGEVGLFSDAIIVRGGNLHAWVEADLDGKGFSIVDPTPPAGIPPASSRVSLLKRIGNLGRELEFFYDRRILGFDALDQGQALENVRHAMGTLGEGIREWRFPSRESLRRAVVPAAGLALLLLIASLAGRRLARPREAPATRAYLALRELVSRRLGRLSPAVPPAQVARLLTRSLPQAGPDARAIVAAYCASAFGGVVAGEEIERDLRERLGRLRRLAS